MASSRTRNLGVAVAVLVVAAAVAAIVTASQHSSGTPNLAPSVQQPSGIVATRLFAPAGLGATVTVPSQWPDTPPSSGFQYTAGTAAAPAGFVGAATRGGVVPVSLSQVEKGRRQLLEGFGAKIDSATTGTVDGRPAVRLHYKLTVGSQSVIDNEYDIIATTTLPVGAAQRQTIYNVITIVVGTPVAKPDQALLDWVGSTIRVT